MLYYRIKVNYTIYAYWYIVVWNLFIIKCVSCVLQSRCLLRPDLLIITVSIAITGQNKKVIACGNEF